MRPIFLLLGTLLLIGCKEQSAESSTVHLKKEISEMYHRHIKDLKNLNHTKLMTHYLDVDDHILFGDGQYWGNYQTVNDIWKNFIGDTQEILVWNLSNEHINLLSNNSASYITEYYNQRINNKGDTIKVRGSVGYGLIKVKSEWRIVTTNVSHFEVD
ncbi:hypothetical protein FVB32_05160 [Flagellimonas hymeniacidonis]|uniref:SnoaL-like domain-containing protein n=2 Tax=Flagellimonas hymeniacidonis TaxID=2603628 RepID=A0A5C8VA64_9FLAO|nr:hypothetical protein FVB32_05160 [Flagellimonas hymeniacidonis]